MVYAGAVDSGAPDGWAAPRGEVGEAGCSRATNWPIARKRARLHSFSGSSKSCYIERRLHMMHRYVVMPSCNGCSPAR